MRYEYKIKLNADIFGNSWECECPDIAANTVKSLREELLQVFDGYGRSGHLFTNIQITVVPHDNDRDYTEEDAERHLNGEPQKKRKTYADDYFEKFPNATKMNVLTNGGSVSPVPEVSFEDVYGKKKAEVLRWNLNIQFPNTLGDHFALWLAEMGEDAKEDPWTF